LLIKSLANRTENFELTDEGSIDKYLGVEICDYPDGSYELKQSYLIERIIDALGLTSAETQKRPMSVASPLLHKDLEGKDRIKPWNYHSIIGMLIYLQGISRLGISMAMHQCACYSSSLKLSHERAVTRIGSYLIDTKSRGIMCREDLSRGLECFVDADFAGGWNSEDPLNSKNLLSRIGFVITYQGIPIF